MPIFQESVPEALNISRQLEIFNLLSDLIEIKQAYVIRRAMNQRLLKQPASLKWVSQVFFCCAPDKVTGLMNDGIMK